jgi:hypothetical protein
MGIMSRWWLTIGLFTFIAVAIYAQEAGRQQTAHVIVTVPPVTAAVAAGARVALRVDVEPKAKMHVYSPEQKDYIPVSLTLEKNPAIAAAPAVFPKADQYFFKALEETALVYSKPFQIVQPVTLASSAKPGATIVVKGTLKYQACDEAVCYRPEQVHVSWTLTAR